MATVLTVPTAAKTLLKNPQRLLPNYVPASDVKDIPRPYSFSGSSATRQNKSKS
jgi:hypothetical protein